MVWYKGFPYQAESWKTARRVVPKVEFHAGELFPRVVKAKAGETVKAGQQIAAVGNTGNSPILHLHFHLQNSPTWFQGEGLPVSFHGVTVNGKPQVEFEPVRGDVVKAD